MRGEWGGGGVLLLSLDLIDAGISNYRRGFLICVCCM